MVEGKEIPSFEEALRQVKAALPNLPEEVAERIARNWSRREPQTMEEVERGRRWEEKNRLEAAASWAEELRKEEENKGG